MPCKQCLQEHQQESLARLIREIISSQRVLSDEEVVHVLFHEIKLRMIPKHECYYHLLGLLTDMLQFNLFEMWCEVFPEEEEDGEGAE